MASTLFWSTDFLVYPHKEEGDKGTVLDLSCACMCVCVCACVCACVCVHVCVCVCAHACAQLLSGAQLFVTPWTVAHQAILSVEFPRQEYWVAISSVRGSF